MWIPAPSFRTHNGTMAASVTMAGSRPRGLGFSADAGRPDSQISL